MKKKSPRNNTLELSKQDVIQYGKKVLYLKEPIPKREIINRIVLGDLNKIIQYMPKAFVDLMIIDPPYNLNKVFWGSEFKKMSIEKYNKYIESWLSILLPVLKKNSTVYICSDWKTSTSVHMIASKYLRLQNRITWEREKGRGAERNWKNNIEDIWFFSYGKHYTFNIEDVKIKRKVLAPYKINGKPKGWDESEKGNFRMTYPSNIWNDLTVPYWSMSENTNHPTQKPEKLIAKLILASSNKGDVVFDPFVGSGTTPVVAKKLNRKYVGIEINHEYAMLTEKRLARAEHDKTIQGYSDEVFWERNSYNLQHRGPGTSKIF